MVIAAEYFFHSLSLIFFSLYPFVFLILYCSHLRPSMLQQLLRRLVFDVPQLNEYCKKPLKVNLSVTEIVYGAGNVPCKT